MTFTRGDTYKFKFARKDANDEIIKTKANKIWFTVKKNYETKDKIIQKTLENGIEFTDDGYYHITIEHEDTKNLEYGRYVYDIQTQAESNIFTISKGAFILEYEVTFEGGE